MNAYISYSMEKTTTSFIKYFSLQLSSVTYFHMYIYIYIYIYVHIYIYIYTYRLVPSC